ncbi:MAG: hypothetical protein E5W15_21185, partial [Mesorhizobium sp.]
MSVALEKQEASSDQRSRRSGGREARRAMRAAPLADDIRPVRPGLEGGSYGPLSQNDQERIHEAVLTLLETVGFANAIPSCIEALTRVGGIYGDDGRIRLPRALVLDKIKRAARNFTLYGQDPKHDMLIQGKRVHYGTAGAAVHLVDVEKREYRESLLQDLYDAARLVDGLDNIHFFQRTMVPRDIPDPLDMDFNTLYACVMGTSKHVGTSFTVRENVKPALEMLYAIAGGEENFRARPFVSNSNCFVVPPMKFAEDACGVLEACVEGGIPILLLSAGQAGATAPAAIAGAVVQAVAEVLMGLVYESAGMHASLLGFCLESLIIDNDMLGHCLRCVRGIEVTDDALSIDTIAEVCLKGPGHYLGNDQTLKLMQTEYFYPAVGDRFSPKEWNEKGRPDILSRAIAEKKRVLAE